MRVLICNTCKQDIEVGTVYNKSTPNIHHAGCDKCGWYESHIDKITLGYILSRQCELTSPMLETKAASSAALTG